MSLSNWINTLPAGMRVVIYGYEMTGQYSCIYDGYVESARRLIPDIYLHTTVERGGPAFLQNTYTIYLASPWRKS